MNNDKTKLPFFAPFVMVSLVTIFFLSFTVSFASNLLDGDRERSFNELMEGYESGAGRFWSVFGDNKDKIDGPVLDKALHHAAAKRDDTLVGLVLEGARIKGDQKALVSLMLDAADYFLSTCRYDEALKLYDASMPLARNLENPLLLAKAYEGNGDISFYSGNPTNALMMYKKAADLYTRGGSLPGQGVVARKMGDVLIQTGDNGQAATVLEKAMSILKSAGDPIEEGNAYRSFGNLAMRQRDHKTALSFFELALARYTAAGFSNGEADIRRAFGETALRTGDNEKAGENYSKALALYDKTGSLIGQGYARKGLADIAFFSGKNDEAGGLYKKALESFTAAGYPLGQADVLRRMGQLNLRTGYMTAARGSYEEALPIYRKVREPVGQADVYKGLGDIGYYGRNFSKALEMYDRALPYYVHAGEPLGQGNVHRATGDIYFYAGDYARAMEYYEKALSLYIKANSPMGQANTYRTIGETYVRLKKTDHALAMFNSAMALYKKTNEPIGQGDIYKTLGEIYLRKGNRMGALDMFREALGYLTTAHSVIDQGHAYQGIGDVFLSAGDLDKSLENYDTALELYRQMQDKESEAFILLKKAGLFGRKEDVRESMRLYEAGLAKLEQVRTQAVFPDMKKSYMEKVYGHYEDAAVFMLDNNENEKAFYYIEAMKARVFLDQLAEARVDLEKGIDPAVKKERDSLEAELFVMERKLAEESRKETPDKEVMERSKKEFSVIQEKLDALRRDIRYKNPLYASVQYPEPIEVKALQEKVLRDGEVLAQYFLSKKGVYCLLVKKKEFNVIKLPVSHGDLISRVKEFLGNMRGHQQKEPFREDLAWGLYDMLVRPLEPFLGESTLIVAPQGILAYLPFEALRTEEGGRKIFMVEKYPVKYIQSGTVLAVLRSQYERDGYGGGFVGFGDPVYDYTAYTSERSVAADKNVQDKNDPSGGKGSGNGAPGTTPGAAFMKYNYLRAGGTLTRLEGSGEEIEGIRKIHEEHGSPARSFLRIDAREENARSAEIGQYAFIHFSTHGILEPGFQAIALSQIPGDKEDGFLTLGEIMNSRFNARLVVLSACETGLGEMSYSEGVTGLTRAVMYAGSAAALVSLWNVADEGTRDLMIRFYEGMINKGMTKTDALRAAKIQLLSDTEKDGFSHPFFWSAFVMYGE
ncbi:MAG: CHAT domain-containing protein [Syntrophorhabdaceae bacterium]|nr:CHAT domain-containing protein [Syntrophorhabdaceae bacterium]